MTKKKKEPIVILKNGFKTIERKRNKKENKKLTIFDLISDSSLDSEDDDSHAAAQPLCFILTI